MKNLLTLLALLLSASSFAQTFEWDKKGADAGAEQGSTLAQYEDAYNKRQVGLAGEYAAAEAGRATIYGERYSPTLLTASHPTLPLGSLVKVTNLTNDQTVTVRVNDKEQTCQDCLITLSGAAADQIGMNIRARVAVERTGFSNWNPSPQGITSAPQPATYGSEAADASPAYNTTEAPVTIKGETYGWDDNASASSASQPAESAVVRPAIYRDDRPAPISYGNATPSVLDREVVRSTPNQADYIPAGATAVIMPNTATPAPRPVVAAQDPIVQAAPPAPTVPYYQDGRTIAAPANYPTPKSAVVRTSPNRAVQPGGAVPTPAVASRPVTSSISTPQTGHVVQLAAYSNLDYARNRVEDLRQLGVSGVFYKTFTKADGSILHRVYSGFYPTRLEAQKAEAHNRNTFQISGVVTELK